MHLIFVSAASCRDNRRATAFTNDKKHVAHTPKRAHKYRQTCNDIHPFLTLACFFRPELSPTRSISHSPNEGTMSNHVNQCVMSIQWILALIHSPGNIDNPRKPTAIDPKSITKVPKIFPLSRTAGYLQRMRYLIVSSKGLSPFWAPYGYFGPMCIFWGCLKGL